MSDSPENKPVKSIICTIDKIIYQDKESGRTIMSVTKDDDSHCQLIAKADSTIVGKSVKADGHWKKNDKYGWQFIADGIEFVSSAKERADGNEPKYKYVTINGARYNVDQTKLICVPKDITSFDVPDSVLSIGNGAFQNCESLEKVSIGKKVKFISKNAFRNCTSLTSVNIGKSIVEIGSYAFCGCTSLVSVQISDFSPWRGFYEGGGFYSTHYHFKDGSGYLLPNIGKGAFMDCKSLKEVIIGNRVGRICENAFKNCTSLTNVVLGNDVSDIEIFAFEDCTSLTSVTLQNNDSLNTGIDFSFCI